MKEASEEKVVLNAEKREGGVYDEFSCSNLLICKYPLREVIRAVFFKCFGFETTEQAPAADADAAAGCCSDESCSCATPDVKEIDPPLPPSTNEPVRLPCLPSSNPGPTLNPVSLFPFTCKHRFDSISLCLYI